MNYVNIILPFVGGLGMFIYGMQIMAQGLENAAGNRIMRLVYFIVVLSPLMYFFFFTLILILQAIYTATISS